MSEINLDQCLVEKCEPEIEAVIINRIQTIKVDQTFDPSPAMIVNGQNLFK